VSLGGADGSAAGRGRVGVGRIIGPSFSAEEIPQVIERLLGVYLRERDEGERFVDVVARLGIEPFKRDVYGERPARQDTALAEAT